MIWTQQPIESSLFQSGSVEDQIIKLCEVLKDSDCQKTVWCSVSCDWLKTCVVVQSLQVSMIWRSASSFMWIRNLKSATCSVLMMWTVQTCSIWRVPWDNFSCYMNKSDMTWHVESEGCLSLGASSLSWSSSTGSIWTCVLNTETKRFNILKVSHRIKEVILCVWDELAAPGKEWANNFYWIN